MASPVLVVSLPQFRLGQGNISICDAYSMMPQALKIRKQFRRFVGRFTAHALLPGVDTPGLAREFPQ